MMLGLLSVLAVEAGGWDINPVLIGLISLIGGAIAAAIPYVFNRYKTAQETRKVSVDSESVIVETSKSLVELVREQMEILKTDLYEANKRILDMGIELNNANKRIAELEREVLLLRDQLK